MLQGDRMALDITLGQGARAHVTTQSATKVHSMDANYAAQTQTLALADDAYLEFLPDPIIPHRRARFVSDTRISVAPSATLLYAEIVQPGRKHHHPEECFGAAVLSMALEVTRPGGGTLFTEKLLIEPQRCAMRQTGVMGPFDVFGNVLVCTPKEEAERIWQRTGAEVDQARGLAFGACRLPNDAGLIFKVLGRETAQVKAKVRSSGASFARRSPERGAAALPMAVRTSKTAVTTAVLSCCNGHTLQDDIIPERPRFAARPCR
jgi:urease accessory protein